MARLVQNRIQRHWFIERISEAELAQLRSVAEQAVALAPDLAQVHVALGLFYYYGYRQYEQALAEFERAFQLQPNNVQALEYSGYVYRRQGQWQRCLDTLKKSLEQDPRNASMSPANFANTYCILAHVERRRARRQVCTEIDPSCMPIGMRTLLWRFSTGAVTSKKRKRVLANFPSRERNLSSALTPAMFERDW